MEIKDLQALYLSGTYCQMTSTRPLTVQNLDKRLFMLPEPNMKRAQQGFSFIFFYFF